MFSSVRSVITGLLLLSLTGCQSAGDAPPFGASGYLADRGVVRLWRKNSDSDKIAIRTLYTPFDSGITEQTDYQWQNGQLILVRRHTSGTAPDDVTLRFDSQGNVSFMQRQLASQREAVSTDSIELYRFDAQRMLQVSNGLQAGRVHLQQGQWKGNDQVVTCDNSLLDAGLDRTSQQLITRQQQHSDNPLYIAWLQGPEGTQLLKISTENLCRQAPKASDL